MSRTGRNTWDGLQPQNLGAWPPPGDLGGVGLFTLLLFAGLAIAVGFGRREPAVIVIGTSIVSAWVMRFWFAEHMYATGNVNLFPRTNVQIFFGMLMVTGLALWYTLRYAIRRGPLQQLAAVWDRGTPVIGLVAGLLFVFASIGGWAADKYMPASDSYGQLSQMSQTEKLLNGQCPSNSVPKGDACVSKG